MAAWVAAWRPGDRVRLGVHRGGWVVSTPRGLRALFPDLKLDYLEACEPDEDGAARFPASRCSDCNREHRNWQDVLCVNCDGRQPYQSWVLAWINAQH